eukprot:Gb_14635 [translate_table: standard]
MLMGAPTLPLFLQFPSIMKRGHRGIQTTPLRLLPHIQTHFLLYNAPLELLLQCTQKSVRLDIVESLLLLSAQSSAHVLTLQTRGTHFVENGSPLYVNGFNSYWLMYVATDPAQRYKVTSIFEQAAAHGLTVARTWDFNDGRYKALQISPGVYDEQVFQALDFVDGEAGILSCRARDGLNLGSLESSE